MKRHFFVDTCGAKERFCFVGSKTLNMKRIWHRIIQENATISQGKCGIFDCWVSLDVYDYVCVYVVVCFFVCWGVCVCVCVRVIPMTITYPLNTLPCCRVSHKRRPIAELWTVEIFHLFTFFFIRSGIFFSFEKRAVFCGKYL